MLLWELNELLYVSQLDQTLMYSVSEVFAE